MTKASVARKFRDKHGMEMPAKKLARIMYNANKLLFKDVEDARTSLRYIEGKAACGKKVKRVTESKYFVKEERSRNPYNLPPSEEAEYTPYVFRGHKKIGVLSDVHLPYHSIHALTLAIGHLKKEKVDGVLLNGDAIDFYQLSRFQKDPSKRSVKHELDSFKSLFEVLEKQLRCKIYYKKGNHCVRYENFLMQKAGELKGVEEFEFENIIKSRARGIEIIGDKTVMKLNSLNGIHGHEYVGGISVPVNIARGLYLKGKVSAFQGHNHATSAHTERDMNGKVTTTYSIGCLCELSPAYMPLNKWNWGLATVELANNGSDYEFHNHTIYKDKVY